MGLFSGDWGAGFDNSSKSDTKNTSNSAGFSDISDAAITQLQGVNLTGGKGSTQTLNLSDQGAIKQAFDFAGAANANSYDFAVDVSRSTAGTVAEAVSAVSESARSETENILINLQKYALYGGLIWGAVLILRRSK